MLCTHRIYAALHPAPADRGETFTDSRLRLREALEGSGINITQLAVMRCIVCRAGKPLSPVAEELEMDRTSLYRAIAPTIRDGWIKATAGTDARSRAAKVTRKENQVLAKAGRRWDSIQDTVATSNMF
jgi:DNA-binding MarR family transcriptional regulator